MKIPQTYPICSQTKKLQNQNQRGKDTPTESERSSKKIESLTKFQQQLKDGVGTFRNEDLEEGVKGKAQKAEESGEEDEEIRCGIREETQKKHKSGQISPHKQEESS